MMMQSSPAWISLIIMAAVLLLILGAVGFIIGMLVRRSRGNADGMVCGGCGYSVRGISTTSCPECGADLRKVGINRPTSGTPTWAIVAIAFFGLLAVLLCGGLLSFDRMSSSVPSTPTVRLLPAPPTTNAGDPVDPGDPADGDAGATQPDSSTGKPPPASDR